MTKLNFEAVLADGAILREQMGGLQQEALSTCLLCQTRRAFAASTLRTAMCPATRARLFEGLIFLAAVRALSLFRFRAIGGLAEDRDAVDRPTGDICQHRVDEPAVMDGIAPHRPPPPASE